MDLRSELTDAQAERTVVEREVHEQLLQLHALQLQLRSRAGQADDDDTDSIKDRMVGRRPVHTHKHTRVHTHTYTHTHVNTHTPDERTQRHIRTFGDVRPPSLIRGSSAVLFCASCFGPI